MNTSSDFLIFDFLPNELVKCLFDSVNSSFISQFPFSFLIEVLAYFLPWDVLTCIPLAVSVLNLSPQYLHLKLCDSWVPSSISLQFIFYEIDVLLLELFLQLNQNVTTNCHLITLWSRKNVFPEKNPLPHSEILKTL